MQDKKRKQHANVLVGTYHLSGSGLPNNRPLSISGSSHIGDRYRTQAGYFCKELVVLFRLSLHSRAQLFLWVWLWLLNTLKWQL